MAKASREWLGIVAQVLAWKNGGTSFDLAEMSAEPTLAPVSRHAVTFIMTTVFLGVKGIGIIFPVLPKLIGAVAPFDLAAAARIGGWIAAVYALGCAPPFGNLSDRFGRSAPLMLATGGLGLDFLARALPSRSANLPFSVAGSGMMPMLGLYLWQFGNPGV